MRQAELDQLRTSLAAVRGMFVASTPVHTGVNPETTTARRAPVAAGSLTDRVLSLVRDAGDDRINMPELVKRAKAPAFSVKKEVKALVGSGLLNQVGFGRHTKYELRS